MEGCAGEITGGQKTSVQFCAAEGCVLEHRFLRSHIRHSTVMEASAAAGCVIQVCVVEPAVDHLCVVEDGVIQILVREVHVFQ